MRFTSTVICCFFAGLAQAQNANPEQMGAAGQSNLNALGTGAPAPLYLGRTDGVEGTPFVDNRWLPALFTTDNNMSLPSLPLKYDVLNHRLLMRKQNSRDSLVLDDRHVVQFVLQEPATALSPARQRVFRRFITGTVGQPTEYAEVLHEGRYLLYKRHVRVVHKAPPHTGYGVESQPARVEDKSVYLLQLPDQRTAPVKLTLKSIQEAAPELAAALKAAAPKTEADWAAALHRADPK